MYQEGEKLEVVEQFGNKDDPIRKGTLVEYIKVFATPTDLSAAIIAVRYGDKILITKETNVRVKSWWRRRKAFKAFNKQMMINNPRLRRYHKNLILKAYYRAYYFIVDKFGGSSGV
jgi:hypothetical protein